MVRINWTLQSVEDLENIAEYIAKDSPKYAAIRIQRIREIVNILKRQPHAGRMVPELNNRSVLELILGNYRIVYQITSKNRIDILTVHHSARLFKQDNIE